MEAKGKLACTAHGLTKLPQCFLAFWELCCELSPKDPTSAFFDTLGFRLVGPFRDLEISEKFTSIEETPPVFGRYFYNIPEVVTVIVSNSVELSYFRDDPQDETLGIVANSPVDGPSFKFLGGDLFGAVLEIIAEKTKSSECSKSNPPAAKRLRRRKGAAEPSSKTADASSELLISQEEHIVNFTFRNRITVERGITVAWKERCRRVVANDLTGIGIVVPYNRETEQGYRSLYTLNQLQSIIARIRAQQSIKDGQKKSKTPTKDAKAELEEIINWSSIANDEGDFGATMRLGRDLYCSDVLVAEKERQHLIFGSVACRLLTTAYTLLGRRAFAEILEERRKQRRGREGK